MSTDPPLTIDFGERGPEAAREAPRPEGGRVSAGAFCPLFAKVVCRKIFACVEPETLLVDARNQGFSNEATCHDALMRYCGGLFLPGVEASVAEGRVTWDEEGFGRCFEGWVERGCEDPVADLPDVPECRKSSIGNVKTNDRCTSAFDCADIAGEEVICAFDENGVGTCLVLGNPGDACEFTTSCRDGLHCRGEKCQPPGKVGEVCHFDEDCEKGLACPDSNVCTNLFKGLR